jgi:hypothetical protein
MGRTRKRFLTQFIPVFFSLWLVSQAAAQTEARVIVNDEIVIERADAVSLDVYFSLRDMVGHAIPRAQVASAVVLLEDGTEATAQIEKPPYYIALVIDASGSQKDVLEEVQAAAIEAIESAPAEVQFAVIRLDENIRLLQPFTIDHAQVIAAVNRVEINDSGTCLYDVAITAVQALEQVAHDAPRRSMLLFTDGWDERRQGLGDACSQNTYDQLVSFASDRDVPVPIHTFGFASTRRRLNSDDLTELSRATGGLSAVGEDEVLSDLFQRIMADVESQWLARAQLLPTQGYHRGSLFVNLADGSPLLAAPVSLVASRSYQAPPEPVTIGLSDFIYEETADLFLFNVSLTSFQQVGSLRVEVIDQQNNVQVDRLIFNSPTLSQQIRLDTDKLAAGRRYITRVTPLHPSGRAVEDENGEALTVEHEFRYDPPVAVRFNIVSVEIEDEAAQFNFRTMAVDDDEAILTVRMRTDNGEQLGRFEGRLISQRGNEQVGKFIIAAPAESAVMTLDDTGGSYIIVVDALDRKGKILAADRYAFIHTSPDGPFVRFVNALADNPAIPILAAILLLLALLVGWLFGNARGRRVERRAARLARGIEIVPDVSLPAQRGAAGVGDIPLVKLSVLESPDETLPNGEGLEIRNFPYTIGREECDLTIAGDRHISRKHAKITYENGIFYILDYGSSNGTFVNEAQIAVNVPTPLSTDIGANIRVGKTTRLAFSEVATRPASASPTPPAEATVG